jgi:hypothetical protein
LLNSNLFQTTISERRNERRRAVLFLVLIKSNYAEIFSQNAYGASRYTDSTKNLINRLLSGNAPKKPIIIYLDLSKKTKTSELDGVFSNKEESAERINEEEDNQDLDEQDKSNASPLYKLLKVNSAKNIFFVSLYTYTHISLLCRALPCFERHVNRSILAAFAVVLHPLIRTGLRGGL